MSRLLYVECSPRKERSASIEIARAFLDAYAAKYPADEVDTLDLWSEELPPFDDDTINAKYAILHGREHTPGQKAAWQAVEAVCARFRGADRYLFSIPMWNFGIPYRLKQYVDVITQPTLTFSFSPEEGYKGLVTGKPAAVVYARGGAYEDGSPMDLQKPYVELWLGFIGFTDIRTLRVEPTVAAGPDGAREAKAAAREAVGTVLETF
jgi:FMN-dependent NADH-azoreductase